jgi:hypothetical protein
VAASTRELAIEALERGQGVLRLAPTWVPRAFCIPGRRIRLDQRDYFAYGAHRGGIDERWLASTVRADNGPETTPTEGLSHLVIDDRPSLTLADAVAELGPDLIGSRVWDAWHGWPMYSKFFDNQGALPFHVHHSDEHAALVGCVGKPEAYYFPPQMNNHGGDFPYSFFGLEPGTTPEMLVDRLSRTSTQDNRITDLSRGYRLRLGTGWDIPVGVLHAPGSLCTYEPQAASDVFSMFENVCHGRHIPADLMWKDVPDQRRGDVAFLVELLDWDCNTDDLFARHRMMEPTPVKGEDGRDDGLTDNWVVYRSDRFSAKETVLPAGAQAVMTDCAAYGLIAVQGSGTIAGQPLATVTNVRFGELTYDEYFVTESAARAGVEVTSHGPEPLVLLRHFGPGNPDLTGTTA